MVPPARIELAIHPYHGCGLPLTYGGMQILLYKRDFKKTTIYKSKDTIGLFIRVKKLIGDISCYL